MLARPVAVKMFDPAVGGVEQAEQRCSVSTLAGLNHPGLVQVYDVAEENGRSFVVMQLIEGESLAERLEAGPLTLDETLRLGAALVDAVAYAHRHGVIHHAVKPSNVLLDAADQPYLSDFAPAAVLTATQVGPVNGTACYVTPEQVRGQPVGPPADVYALGLMLAECLTGYREYFSTADHAAIARLHRPLQIPPQLPTAVVTLLESMTADEPTERPTAEGVAEELTLMIGETITHWRCAGQIPDEPTQRGAITPVVTSDVTLPTPTQTNHRLPALPAAGATAVAGARTKPAAVEDHRGTGAQDHEDVGTEERIDTLDALLGGPVDMPAGAAVTAVAGPRPRHHVTKRTAALLTTGGLATILAGGVFIALTSGGATTDPPVSYRDSPGVNGGSPATGGGGYQSPSGENGVVADGVRDGTAFETTGGRTQGRAGPSLQSCDVRGCRPSPEPQAPVRPPSTATSPPPTTPAPPPMSTPPSTLPSTPPPTATPTATPTPTPTPTTSSPPAGTTSRR